MKTYHVSIPISGLIYATVEAESKKEAIEKALQQDFSSKDIDEWQTHEHLVQGNVFYGVLNEVTAQEEK